MNWKENLRKLLRYLLIGSKDLVLEAKTPQLERRFEGISSLGLYLHIPFCRQICPYCPYNKELYCPTKAQQYKEALIKEVNAYAPLVSNIPMTSFYIGGGTPTTMIHGCLEEILDHIYRTFKMQCDIHMESHPNDLSETNLNAIAAMGVAHLSIGVEALQDHHLHALCRLYTADQVRAAVLRAVSTDFSSVNADFMFALPHQSYGEVEQTARELIELGVDQVAAYPIFTFPYTRWSVFHKDKDNIPRKVIQRRKMMVSLERIFQQAGFERTSVWAFTKQGVPKYCSVTVPRYIGLGASGGSYLDDVLYFNTFNVSEYIVALENGRMPIALSMELSRRMQMAGWLYWRIYETRFRKSDFQKRFGQGFDKVYGLYMKMLSILGFLSVKGDEIVLSDHGAYWLHVLQDLFSIDYVSRLWGISENEPWPRRVVL